MRYKSVNHSQLRDIIWFVIKYRDMYCIFKTVSMWSFHDRLLLTVTPSSLAVEQDLLTEPRYGLSVLDCRIRRFCLGLWTYDYVDTTYRHVISNWLVRL